ncbi:MAG: hypothetical protein A3F16_03845, partial [Deltaproteobacteria bacterium RIFCSPHIGHO2_12_FULL_43_9]
LTFLLVAVASLIFSPYPTPPEAWAGLKKLRFFGYYFLVFYGLYEGREIRLPIIGFLFGCTFAAILAWAQYWLGDVSIVTLFNPDIMESPFVEGRYRAIGFMSHHRRFAMVIALAIPIVASLLIHLRQGWGFRLLYIFLLALFGGALIWTNGRGVMLAIIFSTIFTLLLRSWKLALKVVAGMFIVGVILAFTIPKDIFWLTPRFFFSITDGVLNTSIEAQLENPLVKSSNDIRVVLWKAGVESFLRHPVLGIGWRQFKHEREKIDAAIIGADKYPHLHPHSESLWIAVELGIVGLFVFAFFWGSLLLRMGRAYRHREGLTQIVKALLFTGVWSALFWLFSGLTDVSLLNSENAAALWFVIGLSSYALFMKKSPQEVAL